MKKFSIMVLLILVLTTSVRAQTAIRRPLQNRRMPQQQNVPLQSSQPLQERNAWNEPGQVINRRVRYDILAAPMFKFSQLNDTFGFLAGGKLGWIINYQYLLGVEGYWLVNDVPGPEIGGTLAPDLAMKYGGLTLEYIIMPQSTVHFSVATLAAMGSVAYDYSNVRDNDTYWVIEPSVNVYLNMTQYLKVGLGAGYRYVSDVDLRGLTGENLSGIVGTLSINFGTYGETIIP